MFALRSCGRWRGPGALATRRVSQFRIPQSDCVWDTGARRVVDPRACAVRDAGLVLGVYYNEHVEGQRAVLTASAHKYDRATDGKLWRLLRLAPVPRLGECRVYFDVDPEHAYVAVAGLGSECLAFDDTERLDESREAIRVAAGAGARALSRLNPKTIRVESFGDAEAAAEGATLGVWQFREYRRPERPPVAPPALLLHDDCDLDGWKVGAAKAQSQNLARFLQEMPANFLNPTSFAKIAVDLLCELDVDVEVRTRGWAASREMGGFVAVGESSVQPPLYVELSYRGAGEAARPVVLVGKGVTFDSGSLDLKPAAELRHMRGDMAGAACVLAATRAAALLRLPLNIRALLPLCELLPSGKSPKFGHVVYSANGKSIRVRLPSREGRLLVADSLVHARNYWPRCIVDAGTMSRELAATLGGAACAGYCNSERLFRLAEAAGARSGDRVWRMPLWRYYEERVLDCRSADVASTGRARGGESPDCAAFLRQFVCDSEWLHLDTYNVGYTKGVDFPYLARGMTGRPTRTLIELLYQMLAEQPS